MWAGLGGALTATFAVGVPGSGVDIRPGAVAPGSGGFTLADTATVGPLQMAALPEVVATMPVLPAEVDVPVVVSTLTRMRAVDPTPRRIAPSAVSTPKVARPVAATTRRAARPTVTATRPATTATATATVRPTVTTPARTPTTPSTSALGARIVDAARSYLGRGIPYVWGGKTAASGFDCSGFIWQVLRDAGLTVPYRTSTALRAWVRPVPAADARPGDLVFYPGHVGVYSGGGRMIDAANPIDDLSEHPLWPGAVPVYGRVPA